MAEPIDLFQTAPEGHMPTARMRLEDLSVPEKDRLGKLAKGHNNIATLIAQGWVILPDPVNRLLPEYRSACLTDLNPNTQGEARAIEEDYAQTFKREHKGHGKRKRIHR